MKIEGFGELLRIFVSENDQWQGKPLYKAIVMQARKSGLAGATVLHGFLGYGASSRIHTTKLLRLSDNLPVVIEIVDKPDKIKSLLPVLDEMVNDGMMTLEKVNIIAYRAGESK